MIGKKFTNLLNGQIVEVKDAFEDIIILSDNTKVKASRILDKKNYEEYIDPTTFFQNQSLLNNFAQKIRQIPDEIISKLPENELSSDNSFMPSFSDSAVLLADPEIERQELMMKYGIKEQSVQTEISKQMEKFQALLSEPEQEEEQENVIRIETDRDRPENDFYAQREIIKEVPKVEVDPIISIFKNVKRNNELKFTLEFSNMIPRSDFIEMMEDSYNTSIIDFLAEEFTNSILENPDNIKNKIVSEIKKIVYPQKTISKELSENENEKGTVTVKKPRSPRQKKTT